ncbi:unnamed protein product [Brassicogethes aeneus]|uniref:Uncharacterized protein n=1 Tax=Brassicogethes aeneus TaxID=1431903 RepID=A0A9P0B072_BRAAE|nr:unnamed protein product [Brassicogethes aeneus]
MIHQKSKGKRAEKATTATTKPEPGARTMSHAKFVTRKELVHILRSCGSNEINKQFHFLEAEIIKLTNCQEGQCKEVRKIISRFKAEYKSRWSKASRIKDRFESKNKDWLDVSIAFPKKNENRRGRPEVDFESSSERTKRLKTKELRNCTPVSVLTYATQMSLRSEGHVEASKVLQEITSTSPERASRYRDAYKKSLELQPQCMSGEDALAVLIGGKLSRHQYEIVRASAPDRFPSYNVVLAAKKLCYPKNVSITETLAIVPLQDLLNHTVQRLIQTIKNVFETHVQDAELDKLCMYTKWGFDGSSGHSSYKQAFHGPEASDSAVFITCMVPIRLVCNTKIIWQNPSPASTLYCRPLKIQFVKESTQVSIAEKSRVDDEIKNIQNSTTIVQDRSVQKIEQFPPAVINMFKAPNVQMVAKKDADNLEEDEDATSDDSDV